MKEQTTIKLPVETKKQVRIAAVEMDTSMGNAALELIRLGLEEYKKILSNASISNLTQSTDSRPAA